MTPSTTREKRCRHFRGIHHAECRAKVNYIDLRRQHADFTYPCFGDSAICPQYSPYTPEELAEQEGAISEGLARAQQGLSPCCGALIDSSRVAKTGRRKGHGQYICTKCKKVAFVV